VNRLVDLAHLLKTGELAGLWLILRVVGRDLFLLSYLLMLILEVAGYGSCPQLSYILGFLYHRSRCSLTLRSPPPDTRIRHRSVMGARGLDLG
jgi:hypothetical protein